MKGSISVSFLLGLAAVVSCVDSEIGEESTVFKHEYSYVSGQVQKISGNIDKYINILVMVIRQGLNNIDPYPLPDVVEKFDEKVWILALSGQFLMKNGIIHNLNTISRRRGNATLRYEDRKLYIGTDFMFDLIIFNYSFVTEIVSLGPRGYLTGTARDLVFHSVLVFDLENDNLYLESLELIEKGEVKVTVSVSKLIDWLANPVVNWLATLYEAKLLVMLRDVLFKIVGTNLPSQKILFL
uniref:Uncharacterized protein n=1 Tax=Cacopsylla melanoneura TaxID=428564 RepID=A0A8D8W4E7_9HEMI